MEDDIKFLHERLLLAAKQDDENLIDEVFEQADSANGNFNINYADGLGNTALHYAVKNQSVNVLDALLSYDDCDVDPQNRIDHDTPLHLIMKDHEMDRQPREYIITELLEAGANFNIKNKYDQKPLDVLSKGIDKDGNDANAWITKLYRDSQVQRVVADDDVADDDDDDDDDDDE